jgi:apolipoprotein N-acyltransferase
VKESRLWTRRIALAIYALATPLAFPHELPGGGAIDLGLGFVWLIPAALAIGIEGRSIREAGRVAFAASLAGHVVLFHWFYVVTVSYGGMPWWLGILSPLAPALYISLFTALFAMAWVRLRDADRDFVVLGAALWVGLDWARAHFLGGFPWATLGYGLHLDAPLVALTPWTGIYGLSFIAAGVGLALAKTCVLRSRQSVRTLIVSMLLLALAHAVAFGRSEASEGSRRLIRIAAVQGNIDQGEKWDEARRNRIFEKYLGLSEMAVAQGAEWVVWPETAVPGFVELDPGLAERLEEFSERHGVALIVGGMGIEPDSTGRRVGAFFDSAFLFDHAGQLIDRYDKAHLVPFGEFVPLRSLFGRVFKALATGISSTDVTPGSGPRVLRWSNPGRDGAPVRVAVPICYELLFPHVIGGFGADGAGVMLAITNDAWYGRTGAPHQFLAMTAMRAAENGRWMVRAANTGISAIIDARGRVRESSALFEDALVVEEVPVLLSQPPTFYARFGDVFAVICVLTTIGVLVLARSKDVAGIGHG